MYGKRILTHSLAFAWPTQLHKSICSWFFLVFAPPRMYVYRTCIHTRAHKLRTYIYTHSHTYICRRCTYTYTELKSNEWARERTYDVAVSVLEMATWQECYRFEFALAHTIILSDNNKNIYSCEVSAIRIHDDIFESIYSLSCMQFYLNKFKSWVSTFRVIVCAHD